MNNNLSPTITVILSENKDEDKFWKWTFMIETYAESIHGLDILKGTKRRPDVPLTTFPPIFPGLPGDPAAVSKYRAAQAAWRAHLGSELVAFDYAYKSLQEWEEVDAKKRLMIITTISDELSRGVMGEERSAAAYFNFIKDRCEPGTD